jgi:hypothetical protein
MKISWKRPGGRLTSDSGITDRRSKMTDHHGTDPTVLRYVHHLLLGRARQDREPLLAGGEAHNRVKRLCVDLSVRPLHRKFPDGNRGQLLNYPPAWIRQGRVYGSAPL